MNVPPVKNPSTKNKNQLKLLICVGFAQIGHTANLDIVIPPISKLIVDCEFRSADRLFVHLALV